MKHRIAPRSAYSYWLVEERIGDIWASMAFTTTDGGFLWAFTTREEAEDILALYLLNPALPIQA